MGRLRQLFSDAFISAGLAIVVFSIAVVVLILVTAVPVGNPYIGVFTFIFLPVLVVVGGMMFVFGALLGRQGKAKETGSGGPRGWFVGFTLADFKQPQQQRRLKFFLIVGVIEMLVLSIGGLRTAEYMDTPGFCGSCHTVMYPEYAAYRESLHARVNCVSCHIGPGAPWLVRSKVTGAKQLFAVLLKTYPHPIESPVESLRPARETCEVCHWPERFSGDLTRTLRRYESDEKNTERSTTLSFKVGGGELGVASGIHWHIGAKVWYLPLDEKRQQIGWVGVEGTDSQWSEYFFDPKKAAEITPQRIDREKRLMDCVDCHNRATHDFRSPDQLIDQAFAQGKIDASLPWIKKKGLEALVPVNSTFEEAIRKVEAIAEYYRVSYPQVYSEKKGSIDKSVVALKNVARLTTFPEMMVTWETHINNLGHTKSPGCFRCHGTLVAPSGKAIESRCDLCHYSPKP